MLSLLSKLRNEEIKTVLDCFCLTNLFSFYDKKTHLVDYILGL